MTNFESARASWAASAMASSTHLTPASDRVAALHVVEGVEGENWLGYESIHPLTWVPGRTLADAARRVE